MYFKRGNGKYGNRKREESGKEGPFKKTLVNTGRTRKKTLRQMRLQAYVNEFKDGTQNY